MTAKKFNSKDFLINNGIIVVLSYCWYYTGNHDSRQFLHHGNNLSNIAVNTQRRVSSSPAAYPAV